MTTERSNQPPEPDRAAPGSAGDANPPAPLEPIEDLESPIVYRTKRPRIERSSDAADQQGSDGG